MDFNTLGLASSKDEKYRALLEDCYTYASKTSTHPSTHNGALLVKDGEVVLRGSNVLPPGVKPLPERFEGPNKHMYPNHAERDVIYKAARQGLKTEGLTMVMAWLPCIPCADAVISAGIEELIVHRQMIERTREGWRDELKAAIQILEEGNVNIIAYDGVVGVKAYMHSTEWDA